MNLLRKIKISEISSVEFTSNELEIISFIEKTLSNLTLFDDVNTSYYFDNDDEWVLKIENKSSIADIKFYGFWEVLLTKYKIGYDDALHLVSYFIRIKINPKIFAIQPILSTQDKARFDYLTHIRKI